MLLDVKHINRRVVVSASSHRFRIRLFPSSLPRGTAFVLIYRSCGTKRLNQVVWWGEDCLHATLLTALVQHSTMKNSGNAKKNYYFLQQWREKHWEIQRGHAPQKLTINRKKGEKEDLVIHKWFSACNGLSFKIDVALVVLFLGFSVNLQVLLPPLNLSRTPDSNTAANDSTISIHHRQSKTPRCRPHMLRLQTFSPRFSAWLINKCPYNFAQLVSHSLPIDSTRKKNIFHFDAHQRELRHLIRWYWSPPVACTESLANDLHH